MSRHVYKGSLNDEIAIQAFATINYHAVPGVYQVASGDTHRRVYFEDGNAVSVYSNSPEDRLGERLKARGKVTSEQLEEVQEEIEASSGTKRLGQILIERGYLKPKQIVEELRSQAEHILMSIFNLREGKVMFTCESIEGKNISRLPLNTRLLLYRGVQDCLHEIELKEIIHSTSRVLHPTPTLTDIVGEMSSIEHAQTVISVIDGKRNIAEIVGASPMNTFETLKLISYLLIIRAVE